MTSTTPEDPSPAGTVTLLDRLVALGFTNSAFRRLHHLQRKAGITAHRSYCMGLAERGAEFRTHTNIEVHRRLEVVLGAYLGGAFKSRSPALWEALAGAAVVEVPFVRV
ncbi:MAG: hypothetical protein O9345_04310 [Burkholderiaceae bacterium]|jgi:hypothetical protein|nr:hypothetical protein [Burkholderiales bacterium]MCZ8099298.1 hypothetical protein [Burkholderiales bacterium]MCZ8337367.1 hypothetical protein [Burkholderiaceae bacterium]